jgi:hypothetical protein
MPAALTVTKITVNPVMRLQINLLSAANYEFAASRSSPKPTKT